MESINWHTLSIVFTTLLLVASFVMMVAACKKKETFSIAFLIVLLFLLVLWRVSIVLDEANKSSQLINQQPQTSH
jgi:high-affinity Fe2+/Pb2+ permease